MNDKNRIKIDIDQHSYLETYNDDAPRNVVLFVHGILGNYQGSLSHLVQVLKSFRIFLEFDFASFGYDTGLIDFRKPEKIIDQFLPWCRAHVSKYQNIYIVTHSMGGLIIRWACIKLLNSNKNEDWILLEKIRHCFLIASPLSGSRIAAIFNRIPILRSLNKKIPFLARPTIGSNDLSERYREASHTFKKNRGEYAPVPQFHIYVGTKDRFVSEPEICDLTDTDTYEGAIEGTHSSVKNNIDINSTLANLITKCVNEDIDSLESQRKKIELVRLSNQRREEAAVNINEIRRKHPIEGTEVILISCSAHKIDRNNILHDRSPGIAEKVADKRVGDIIMEKRLKILTMIQEGRIEGIEFQEGNRASRKVNQDLYLGPDFGGVNNEERFLPAYLRYGDGRCYQANEDEWKAFLKVEKRPHILIMSGLYGLPTADEYIQNYDCHLTDVDRKTGFSIQSYWRDREFMTSVLISYIEWIEQNGRPVSKVIDLLSELSYQETINWSMIYPRWSVYHRVFESTAGRYSLENIGIWLRDVIRNPALCKTLEHDVFYENKDFYNSDKVAFESRIGFSTLKVSREVTD
ncbi:MAG: hypothetical protein JXB42_08185 [Deltaproteobacteria bacterium]|nr:hypothetical protein [Deltaproteobacteria bacterium]